MTAFGDQVALSSKDGEMTYRALNEASNKLANYLITHYKIKAEDRVGIIIDRSFDMIIAILAVMKSGAAYLPIDSSYPKGRRRAILEDAGIEILLTQSDYLFDSDFDGPIYALDLQLHNLTTSNEWPAVLPSAESLAYVLYTSGSTGKPKGCCLTHRNLHHYLSWASNYYFQGMEEVNFGLFTSISFDLTITSLFCPLLTGGRLHVYSQFENITSVFEHYFHTKSKLNCIKMTPAHISVLQQMAPIVNLIGRIILGGEKVVPWHLDVLYEHTDKARIFNEYGPTEITVGCTVYELNKNDIILIGVPIARTTIHILSPDRKRLPAGVFGEICVGGTGVARGYLHRKDLTDSVFINDPYDSSNKLYRTGDIGRWLPNGNIEFFGRKDDQLKIRGHRVEVAEIENALRGHIDIDDAVVSSVNNNENEIELIGYIVSGKDLKVSDIRKFLETLLPAYMYPSQIIAISEIPLTENGKVDRKALPIPQFEGRISKNFYEPPSTELELKLADIWTDVLDKELIGLNDDFFDLGGHSLKAIKLLSLVSRELNIKFSIEEVFRRSTIKTMAQEILRIEWANSKRVSLDEPTDILSDQNFIL